MQVLRWGRSSYELDADLAAERQGAASLGLGWSLRDAEPERRRCEILVVTSHIRVDAALLDLTGCRWVITTTSGHDHVVLGDLLARGVRLVRCPRARRDAVVEHALAGLTSMLRRLPEQHAGAVAGRWARAELPALAPRALMGSRVAVVGLGVIGRRMGEVLGALGAEVLGVDPSHGTWELEPALAACDAVTLHCSLSATSQNLLSAARLELLPRHAVVVNTARGDVLDLAAALALVEHGRLRGLVVDTFPQEPYADLARGNRPGVWFTPHSAGFTHDLGARLAEEVVDALRSISRGEAPAAEVNLDLGA